jgi:hypothetical protein
MVQADLENRIKQPVLNVIKNVKYHSNLQTAGLFIARIAIENEEDSDSFLI